MVKIDLITGFLGAGKTTFIKAYARYLMDQGLTIGILENDHGAVNVDMMLLQELEGENCELEMVAGGCDVDCHRRRFRTKLISMGMCGYDCVIVEPSGVYDVDEFFDALREEPLDQWYEIGNVIALVDANLDTSLSEKTRYLLASEVAEAGCVILSHADEATDAQMDGTIAYLKEALVEIHCKRDVSEAIIRKSVCDFTDGDFSRVMQSGYATASFEKRYDAKEDGFATVYLMDLHLDAEGMYAAIDRLFTDESCGRILRIKGFLQQADGTWQELNATRNNVHKTMIKTGQDVVIIIGETLDETRIREVVGV